jgi:choline dehydrogenase-like flavoprotein
LEGSVFFQTGVRPDLGEAPDAQILIVSYAGSAQDFYNANVNLSIVSAPKPTDHGVLLLPALLHPQSRGTIKLKSADPFVHPEIDPHYLEHPNDVKTLVAACKTAWRAMTETAAGRELNAGNAILQIDEVVVASFVHEFPFSVLR